MTWRVRSFRTRPSSASRWFSCPFFGRPSWEPVCGGWIGRGPSGSKPRERSPGWPSPFRSDWGSLASCPLAELPPTHYSPCVATCSSEWRGAWLRVLRSTTRYRARRRTEALATRASTVGPRSRSRPGTAAGSAPTLGTLQTHLEHLFETYDREAHRRVDPVSFVHMFEDGADQEVVGLLAAALAFGNVTSVRRSIRRVLDVLGEHPAEAVQTVAPRVLRRRLAGFTHRVYSGADVAHMLSAAGDLIRAEGSLGAAFTRVLATGDLRTALASLAYALRGDRPGRGLAHLVPDPMAGSACKRLLLYLRWMVRPADGVDLGLWQVSPAVLLIPVDTHILRIAQNLGLTRRRVASWRTAQEITDALRRFDARDPVRYDFALCHLGISRQCPPRRDDRKCQACILRPACTRGLPMSQRAP
ncbi:MAG: TIGR02757 family protein [Myxococcales bacterium]|nr:TIGR02757 family protein [Myxococcales bacterium]